LLIFFFLLSREDMLVHRLKRKVGRLVRANSGGRVHADPESGPKHDITQIQVCSPKGIPHGTCNFIFRVILTTGEIVRSCIIHALMLLT
jgi:hypothetical protein